MSYRKVGGLRFFRIGRIQLSFCILRDRTLLGQYRAKRG
jgi:hypothetical protein